MDVFYCQGALARPTLTFFPFSAILSSYANHQNSHQSASTIRTPPRAESRQIECVQKNSQRDQAARDRRQAGRCSKAPLAPLCIRRQSRKDKRDQEEQSKPHQVADYEEIESEISARKKPPMSGGFFVDRPTRFTSPPPLSFHQHPHQ